VIHKGKFPERDETIKFGDSVLNCALPILRILKSQPYSSALGQLTMESVCKRASAERQKGLETATMAMPTFLCFCTADEPSSVENAVANYAKQPDYEDYVKKMQAFSRIYVPG
ncbi:hypothetical protein, partial [Acetobacter orientalis]|uniref:hypothetical protein n=1 Tax=Acetobacter orientalis TaxID=146474 RepID=UPI001C5B9591